MKKSWLTAILAGSTLACIHPNPAPPAIELRLELAENSIGAGDRLWYRLELRNISRKTFRIYDPFWCDQNLLGGDGAQTQFFVFDSSGVPQPPYFSIPFHSPYAQWKNDSTGHACADGRLPLLLEPGKSLIPTPPIQDEGPRGLRALDGYRHLPQGRYLIKAVFVPRDDGGSRPYETAPIAFEVL